MPKKKIVLEFVFDSVVPYPDEPDYVENNLVKIKLNKDLTTMSDEERDAVAEEAGQSDFWQVDVHNGIFRVIDSGQSEHYS